MAAVANPTTVNVTINDVELQVPKGELIVETVKRLGLEVPVFCYHPRMKPVGMCRMCLVEVGFKGQDGTVKMMPKPQAACTLPASDGMVVVTDSEMVHRDRRGVLEFLLINHPLDCPICDRGGECPLQNNTLFYGPSTSRFIEVKRHLPKAYPLSQFVTLDLERCIQCGRCVRFTEEISGDSELAFRFRGAMMQPSTFELRDFESKFSGNVIEICPVGALTNSKYRFRARPWDLQTTPGICTMCSNGCNVWVDWRVGEVVRINGRTNDAVNEEWTCDKGKFGHDAFNDPDRPTRVLVRLGDQLVETEWADAYGALLGAFRAGGSSVACLAGGTLSNESLFLMQSLFREQFGSNNLDHRFTKHLQKAEERLENRLGIKQVQTKIADFENKSAILVFGTSLADEEPILFLRIRKAWFKNATKVIVATSESTEADTFAQVLLRYKAGTERALADGLLAATVESGKANVPEPMRNYLKDFSPERVAEITDVPAEKIREAAALMGSNAAVVTATGLFDTNGAQGVLEILGGLAMTTGAQFNCFARSANEQGASELGFVPDAGEGEGGMNTWEILEGCSSGKIKALWLTGLDPFKTLSDRELVTRALENVEFLVVQDCLPNEAIPYASVVLPMTAPVEEEGSYTNLERRVQVFGPVLSAKGDARPAWRVATELAFRIQPQAPFFNAEEVRTTIAREMPAFAAAIDPGNEGATLE